MIGLATSTIYAAEEKNSLPNEIQSVDFTALSGGRINVRVMLKTPMTAVPPSFALSSPARIAFDFPQTANGLNKNTVTADQGALKSVSLAQAKDRTRMVLNLNKNVGYNTTINGNEVLITLQGSEAAANTATAETRFAEGRATAVAHEIKNVDFARGKNGEGRVIVDLADASSGINIKNKGKTIVIDFIDTEVPAELQRRLNVINFNTPVLYVDTIKRGKNGQIIIEPKGDWEQSAYQADNKFIVDVRPVVQDPNKLVQGTKQGFSGEKLSLNFQNIEVRSVLQVIADFTGMNIVASDSVTGNITLRLKDVPWDQALDVIMKNRGLDMRKSGNVISIAPAEEIAAKEKAALESTNAIEDLEALHTEVFTLKYQKAENFKKILTGEDSGSSSGGQSNRRSILSKRGSAVWDPRTNTIFIQDTSKKLEEIQSILNKIDVPVKQVMIESRLVIADDKFSKSLGARFGVTKTGSSSNGATTISGTLGNRPTAITTNPTTGLQTLTQGTHNGSVQTSLTGGAVTTSSDGQPDLMSNLPVSNAFGSVALSLFRIGANTLLNLELSALETDNRGKVISSPRVTTANQQKASIAQGTRIPYQQTSSSGATNIAFVDATLSLDVTPQITPDDKIIMDLDIKKDRVGTVLAGVPSIDTQNVKTQVLVTNGETAVLGGIYEETQRNDVDKVPFFGDLPIIGNAFKRRTKQEDRTELLIFITPRIMDESLGLR
ncbi:MAG: type IV pilus secretin PilQ [Methylophilus sp.]|nr:type IV pilus secretin PilQ [Methylophilus sp.]